MSAFLEFVNAYVLLSRHHPERPVSSHDRFTYILDHNNPTPGKDIMHSFTSLTLRYLPHRFRHSRPR